MKEEGFKSLTSLSFHMAYNTYTGHSQQSSFVLQREVTDHLLDVRSHENTLHSLSFIQRKIIKTLRKKLPDWI